MFVCLIVSLGIVGCSYSFTGASIEPDVKTVSINVFQNNAPLVVPTLAQNFTESLRDKFITQTSLQLSRSNGDLQFSGVITDYSITPLTIQGDQAAQNRMTLSLRVQFINVKHPEKNWEESFSNFVDFPRTAPWPGAEPDLILEVQNKLIQDIFNKALANW